MKDSQMEPNNGIKNNGVYSWDRWAIWVVETLKEVKKQGNDNHDEMLILKTKVTIIGAAAGILFGSLSALIVNLLMH